MIKCFNCNNNGKYNCYNCNRSICGRCRSKVKKDFVGNILRPLGYCNNCVDVIATRRLIKGVDAGFNLIKNIFIQK